MNPKIKKLKTERQKNEEKISLYRSRNTEIDKQITELENLDIVGLVRSVGLTPEQLAELIRQPQVVMPSIREEESNYV